EPPLQQHLNSSFTGCLSGPDQRHRFAMERVNLQPLEPAEPAGLVAPTGRTVGLLDPARGQIEVASCLFDLAQAVVSHGRKEQLPGSRWTNLFPLFELPGASSIRPAR